MSQSQKKNRPLVETIQHYQVLRDDAYAYVQSEFLPSEINFPSGTDHSKICIAGLNRETLDHTKGWEFDWPLHARRYLRHPRRFELSIWYDNQLNGLALGRVSKGSSRVRIDLIERAPGSDHLKGYVFPIALECSLAYALNIGRESVVIKNPKPELVDYYVTHFYEDYVTHYPRGVRDFRFDHIKFDLAKLLAENES